MGASSDLLQASPLHLSLTIDGNRVEGDSTVRGCEGLIELHRFRWSAAVARQPMDIVTASGRPEAPLTALRLGQLHLDKGWDRASPTLLHATALGLRADTATLTWSDPPPADSTAAAPLVLRIELTDVALLNLDLLTQPDEFSHPYPWLRERLVLGGARTVRLWHTPRFSRHGTSGTTSAELSSWRSTP